MDSAAYSGNCPGFLVPFHRRTHGPEDGRHGYQDTPILYNRGHIKRHLFAVQGDDGGFILAGRIGRGHSSSTRRDIILMYPTGDLSELDIVPFAGLG